MEEKTKCPYCGSESVARILYGLPAFSDELNKEIEEGKISLGGCCVFGDSPEFHCNTCHKEWGLHMKFPEESEE